MNNSFRIPDEDDTPILPARPNVLAAYPPSLPHDMARCVDDNEVDLVRVAHGLTEDELHAIVARMDFRRELSDWQRQLVTSGHSFRLKLRAMAEEFLPKLHQILDSDMTAPSVKVDAFKYITRCAELEPTKEELQGDSAAGGNKIVIEIKHYTPDTPSTTIDITPIRPSPPGLLEDDGDN